MAPIQQSVTPPINVSPVELPNQIALGEYLFYRISQANPKLRTIFGIPGDFNVDLLEHVYSPIITNKLIKLINPCNELNGAYAADGYSRAIGGLSVFISTYGVGELSAINGIAGAFSEYSPVLHIVGTTSIKDRLKAETGVYNIHHLVPNIDALKAPNHDVYKEMVQNISVIQESLDYDVDANLKKIDRVLKKIVQESRPGYLFIPCDVPDFKVLTNQLFLNPFNADTRYAKLALAIEVLEDVTDHILDKLYLAETPSIFSDCLTSRFGYQKQLDRFINKVPKTVKLFSANLARNLDETQSNYVGVYNGRGSSDIHVREEFESSDLILALGMFDNEMNSGGHTTNFNKAETTVIVHPDYIRINHQIYHIKQNDGERFFTLGELLESLTLRLNPSKVSALPSNIYQFQPQPQCNTTDLPPNYIPQGRLIDYFNTSLQPNDLVILETMSFVFALPDLKFPTNSQLITSPFYGSIGYAVPAAFGATVAVNDLGSTRRIIVVQGDGAAQMTAQELSSYVRYKDILPNMPQIFLVNNDGYSIERKIRGPTRSYNDINGQWKWAELLGVFGGVKGKMYDSWVLKNTDEFERFFNDKPKPSSSKLQFYELIAGKFDVPQRVDNMMCQK
ncbi:Transaminated amino acid decarboxylase [Candida viswanathii]|uniref:Transaminated amino acid decarboxylase n=1 Tax=Candida viswanathii TaxID=5486 RepID=A0A367XZJ0_9ASCO|nr:Transaminated amino acid decarboxylase [Candida viswanathii]